MEAVSPKQSIEMVDLASSSPIVQFKPITFEYKKNVYYTKERNVLGSGTYGTVYKYYNYAIKIMVAREDYLSISIIREINVLRKYTHPNITRVIDVIVHAYDHEDNLGIGLVMDYAIGDLFVLCKSGLNSDEKNSLSYQILCGVAFLHHHNIIHRDLKLQNILVFIEGDDMVAKIADVGMAVSFDYLLIKDFDMGVYTIWYRPPELLLKYTFTMESDLWAVGILLYYLYEGVPLFNGETESEQLDQIISLLGMPQYPNIEISFGKLTPSTSLADSLNSNIANLILKCLKLEPKERASAYELLSDSQFDSIRDFTLEFTLEPLITTMDKSDVITDNPFELQTKFNGIHLKILQNWLILLGLTFKLELSGIFLTLKLLDIILCKIEFDIEELQLVGTVCMYIAAIEDSHSPNVNEYLRMSEYSYSYNQFHNMMYAIIKDLQFDLIVSTPYLYLLDSGNMNKIKRACLFILATSNVRYLLSSSSIYTIAQHMVNLYYGYTIPPTYIGIIGNIEFDNVHLRKCYKSVFRKLTPIDYDSFLNAIKVHYDVIK